MCNHRTVIATGNDDLVRCPYCGKLRDRKAYYCMWCNNTMDKDRRPTKAEKAAAREDLNDFISSFTEKYKILED